MEAVKFNVGKNIAFGQGSQKPSEKIININEPLLPSYTDKKIDNINQIVPVNLVLVHMTNYLPKDGVIKSTRNSTKDADGVSSYRNTVHFALNHAVYEHKHGNAWGDMKVAVLAPLDGVVKSNPKDNIVGGALNDFFIKDHVKLPEGSIIVRQSSNVPKDKLRVINAEAIEEFKNTKGITVLETSGSVKEAANRAVEMMGYTRIDKMQQEMSGMPDELMNAKEEDIWQNPELLEKAMNLDQSKIRKAGEEISKAWINLVNANGFKNYPLHSTSPYGRSEALIEGIKLVALKGNTWEHQMQGGLTTKAGEKVDYKKEFLQVIQETKQSSGENEILTYDIDKLEIIIKESKTPNDALEQISYKLKLKPMIPIEDCLPSVDEASTDDIYRFIDTFVGISPLQKTQFNGANADEIQEALKKQFGIEETDLEDF